ncbi:MAG: O-antigen ligase family protein [Solirubrobacteraceae bacterium]
MRLAISTARSVSQSVTRAIGASARSRGWRIGFACIVAMGVGAAVAYAPVSGLVLLGLAGAAVALQILAGWSSPVLVAALVPMAFALLAPRSLEAAGEGVLAAFAVATTIEAMYRRDPRWVIGAACLAVPGVWLLLGLNTNVPGASAALLGTRKTTLVFVGLAVGALWPSRTARNADRTILSLLVFGGALSLVIHFAAPNVEIDLSRSAGLYTSLFAGKLRLEGIFPGPFHVALLGTFLLLRAWHVMLAFGRKRTWTSLAMIGLGGLLVILAEVRTAYLTLALGVVLTLVFSPQARSMSSRLRLVARTATLGLVIALFLASGLASNAALTSVPDLGSNSRAAGRLVSIRSGVLAFARSPIVGDGPGSAGAADSALFVGKEHLTADDEFLAILVEAGLVGVLVVGAAVFTLSRFARGVTSPEYPAAAALYCLVGFCCTNNAFEAIPVSTFLAITIGLSANRSRSPLQRGS